MDQNYKNSPEGKEVQRLYADILSLSRPAPARTPMNLVQRAKIFTPYDALRGFDEAIDAVGETSREVSRIELSEEKQQELSDRFSQLHKGVQAAVAFFVPRSSAEQGFYMAMGGTILNVDSVNGALSMQESVRYTIPNPDTALPCLEEILREICQGDSGSNASAGSSSPSRKPVSSSTAGSYVGCLSSTQPSASSHKLSKDLPTVISFNDVLEIRSQPPLIM